MSLCFAGRTHAQGQQQPAPTPQTQATPQAASAQPVGEVIEDDEVLRIDSNLVSIPAVVTESTGRAVPDLRLEDFELRIDGQLRPVGELHRADAPVVLAVLFDNSSSLSQAREFEKQAATRFFRRIVRPIDRAAIYSISTVPVLSRPLTSNVGVLVRTIESFAEPEGATALFDTISEAASYLRPYEARKVIVLVSDGNDTISDATFDQALQRALKSDCQIYVVGTGDIENPNLTDTIARKRLHVLAAQTGGALYVPRTVEDLDGAFEQIFKDISQQYVLSFYPTDDPADGRFRAIDVRVRTRPTLRVRAREGYYASAGQTASAATVRPRRANSERDAEASRGGNRNAPTQVASLDPLYSQPLVDATRRNEAVATTSVSIKAKATTGARALSRNGPQENIEQAEPERPAPSSRTSFEPQPARSTVEAATPPPATQTNYTTPAPRITPPTPAPTPSQTLFSSAPAQTLTAAQRNTSTLEAVPQTTTPEPTTQPTPQPVREQPARETTTPSVKPKETPREATPRTAISGGVLNGKAKSLPKPIYPSSARSAGVKGTVTVEVEINEDGKVISAQIASGPALLQSAAIFAARQARFSPTLLSGQPVKVKGVIIYNFL